MKLYFALNTRAVRPRWLLEEAGASYTLEIIDLQSGQQTSPEYLRINPNGHVPALVDGRIVLIEATAITMYLADRFPDAGLAPAPDSKLRPLYYQWMFYASSIELHLKRYSMLSSVPGLDRELDRRRTESESELSICARVISDRLRDGPYLLGEQFSAADITIFQWLWELEKERRFIEQSPAITAYLRALEARPARQRAVTLKI